AAILLISEDLEELFSLSDRVAGLYSGQITGYMDIGEVTDETFKEAGRLMLGIKKSENKSHSVSSVAAAL
ncbi:MAG: heme ABC transporter ATP-binding protein, partial [Fastidiosipila sp.]|nr:heme ABC transporter ATP-binding protein [Fastidiosipila sp.]